MPKARGCTRVFFASDIHGSDLCFKKFLNAGKHYEADVLVMGGDVTGKTITPLIRQPNGSWCSSFNGDEVVLETNGDAKAFEKRIADLGGYVFVCDGNMYEEFRAQEERRNSLFMRLVNERMSAWVELADERMKGQGKAIYFNTGNDDTFSIDAIIDQSTTMVRPEGQVVAIDQYVTMVSCGFSNLTPWCCPRDISEDSLRQKIDSMLTEIKDFTFTIFNFHCPPYGKAIDIAPALDERQRPKITVGGVEPKHVGSTAVRDTILQYQPCLGLHGHIHEAKGFAKLGKTVCLNPGSEYHEGVLRGILIDFRNGILDGYSFTSG